MGNSYPKFYKRLWNNRHTNNRERAFCLQGNGIGRSDNAGCNGRGWNEEVGYTLNTADRHAVAFSDVASTLRVNAGTPKHEADAKGRLCLSIENHPNDSRVKLCDDNIVQTLSGRMGTGGGNTPLLMTETFVKSSRAKSKDDATTWKQGGIANTLNVFDVGETRCNELVVNKSNE